MLIVMFIGGLVGKYNLRATLALSFIPYFVGTIMAYKIEDFGELKKAVHNNPIKDMYYSFKEILNIPDMKTYLGAYILGREVTHSQIWIFTPLMVMVGVPIEIVSLGWIIDQIMRIIGAKISIKFIKNKMSTNFAICIFLVVSWISIILIKLNIYTVWVFVLNGITVGLASGTLVSPLQEKADQKIQTSVMSLASTGGRLLYIPLVFIINYLGELNLLYALAGVIIIFVPLSLIVYNNLRRIEKRKSR